MQRYRTLHWWLGIPAALLVFLLPTSSIGSSTNQSLQGAAVVIKLVGTAMQSDPGKMQSKFADRITLAREMELFGQINQSLNADEAAEQWLVLVEQYLSLPTLDPRQIDVETLDEFRLLLKSTSFKSLIEIIPGPDSWPVILSFANQRFESQGAPDGYRSICLIMNLLTLNIDRALEELEYFEKKSIEQSPYGKEQIQTWFANIKREVKKFDRSTKAANKIEAFSNLLLTFKHFMPQPAIVRVPDLLAETDKKSATDLLQQALANPNIYLVIPSGEETQKLGISVGLDSLDSLKRPQWGLVGSIDSDAVIFFERLYEKFEQSQIDTDQDYTKMVQRQGGPTPFEGESELKQRAISYYILGLLAQGRIDDALLFAGTLDNEMLSTRQFKNSLEGTENTGLFKIYSSFLDQLLQQKPALGFWKQYVSLALINHEEQRVIAAISQVLSENRLDFLPQQELKKHLITLYLAQDKIQDALVLYHEIGALDSGQLSDKVQYDFSKFRYDLGGDLYELGKVTKDQDLVEDGMAIAVEAFNTLRESSDSKREYLSAYKLNKIVSMLIEQREYARAEEFIVDSIINNIEQAEPAGPFYNPLDYTLPDLFVELAKLYVSAGKYSEVIILLEQSPWWNAEDLADLIDREILLPAAQAINATGNPDTAGRILKHYILQKSNDDEAYRLLIDIGLHDTLSWLDRLYTTDRFEERPLIWKAQLLYQQGSYDEAEVVIRRALSVDPTDGEQKAGQRVYSYSLLADILEAKGSTEDAAFFRDVVNSVRIAERGDELSDAGLITRSIGYYQEAMAVFADAYCIQWRLGERLYATGDLEGAKKHYKIAFERMPEQFGQVASFCFGCEGAFDKMESRSAAEEVFAHLLETTPNRPQVYFLYGLLRKSQKRLPEAYQFFKQAVTLDEDYLDAWKEISKLSESVYLSREEKDQIILKMLQLDPQQKHFNANLSEVVDITGLWRTLEQNQGGAIVPEKSLYELRASAKRLKQEREQNSNTSPEYFYEQLNKEYFSSNRLAPAEVMSEHPMVSMVDYFIKMEQM